MSVLGTYALEYGSASYLILPSLYLSASLFINDFLRGMFPAECEVLTWYSHLLPILSPTQCDQYICTNKTHVAAPLDEPFYENEASSHPVRIAS